MGDASGLPGTEGPARVYGILRRLGHRNLVRLSALWYLHDLAAQRDRAGALLLETPGVWWVYLLAALPTHLHVVTSFQEGVPLAVMLSQFTTNAVHIIVGAAAVRAVSGAPPRFDSLRGMAAFILLAAIGAGAIACAVAVALFQLTGWITDPWLAWRQRRTASPSSRSRRISRSIVEAHGGRIWAAANPDRGLTLHVELPTRVYPGTDVQDHLRAKAVG